MQISIKLNNLFCIRPTDSVCQIFIFITPGFDYVIRTSEQYIFMRKELKIIVYHTANNISFM